MWLSPQAEGKGASLSFPFTLASFCIFALRDHRTPTAQAASGLPPSPSVKFHILLE